MKKASILIVDDNPGVLSAGQLLLKRHFQTVDTTRDPDELSEKLAARPYDAVLLDMNFHRARQSGQEGLDLLEVIRRKDPAIAVVLMTAYGDVELAVRAIKNGATDFVLKPWDNDKLVATLHNALAYSAKPSLPPSADASFPLPKLIFRDKAMQQVVETLERVAQTDANVLLLGENGTGKDLAAQLLHGRSGRAGQPFVKVDVGALPESLFESELFGHVRGAFTDAREDRAGRFEEAVGGTIFLDEIGNLTLLQQARLLTVLQNRTVARVGDNRARQVDVRLVAATNRDLYEAVRQKTFRQDLLYRINTIEVLLPPLRERPDDIELLAGHFLHVFAAKYHREAKDFSAALVNDLRRYSWPGNVRELQHAVERAVILSSGKTLRPEDFLFRQDAAGDTGALNLDEMEKNMIARALDKHQGNITEAAAELGLTRASLYRRLEKLGLK